MSLVLKNTFLTVTNCFKTHQVRYLPRWNHRKPVKVYAPEEFTKIESQNGLEDLIPNQGNTRIKKGSETDWKPEVLKFKIKPQKVEKPLVATFQKTKKEQRQNVDMLQTVIDADGNFIYTKMNNNDHRIGSILTTIKSKKFKEKDDLMLLEGKRLIKDALQSGCSLKYIVFTRINAMLELKPFLPKLGFDIYKMPYREMQMWSDLTTNPGIMGIFKIPEPGKFETKDSIPLTIICDNIREPGNLGSILRIAAGVGCANVYLTKGCVNLWEAKVLRSSAGAHFKLAIKSDLQWTEIEKLIGPNAKYLIADNKVISDVAATDQPVVEVIEKVPIIPYFGLKFQSSLNYAVVVGGETLGVSRETYEVAARNQGVRLNIPLSNEVESLNVGAALGIISFEIKKQLLQAEFIHLSS